MKKLQLLYLFKLVSLNFELARINSCFWKLPHLETISVTFTIRVSAPTSKFPESGDLIIWDTICRRVKIAILEDLARPRLPGARSCSISATLL
mgnify:CR=1 FL=1